MYIKLTHALLFALLPVCTVHAQKQRPTTPAEVIRDLTSADYRTRLEGLSGYHRLSANQRTPNVKAALIQALKNQNEVERQSRLRGLPWCEGYDCAEGALLLAQQVHELNDPATIPVLLPWLCCAYAVMERMIDFGRQSFEPVLEFVESPQLGKGDGALSGGLETLRMMVDHWGLSTFSTAERQRMKQVATMYIAGEEPYSTVDGFTSTVTYAITLAASLQEEELLLMAQGILSNDAELTKRKIAYQKDRLQGTLSRALAGTLELWQYVPYEQRQQQHSALLRPYSQAD